MWSSGSSGFWKGFRTTDKALHTAVFFYQKSLRRLEKADPDINFLNKCKDKNAFAKFVRLRNVKHILLHIKNNLYQKNLNNVIKERNNEILISLAEHDTYKSRLKKVTIWIKNAQSKISTVTSARYQKKHFALILDKIITAGIKKIQIM